MHKYADVRYTEWSRHIEVRGLAEVVAYLPSQANALLPARKNNLHVSDGGVLLNGHVPLMRGRVVNNGAINRIRSRQGAGAIRWQNNESH